MNDRPTRSDQRVPGPARRWWRRLLTLLLLSEVSLVTLGFSGALHPAIDLVSHFQLPLLIGGAALLALCAISRSGWMSLIALALCAVTLARVAPFWVGGGPNATPVAGSAALRVMSVNVLKGNRDYQSLLEKVANVDPDVLVLNEFAGGWRSVEAPLRARYPHAALTNAGEFRTDGVAIFSKRELRKLPTNLRAIDLQFPCVIAEVETGAQPVTLIALHALAPMSPGMSRRRDEQLALANSIVQRYAGSPAIVAGDCNATPWSYGYRLLTSGTTLRNTRLGRGVAGSWPDNTPSWLRIPIDHILVSERIGVRTFRVGGEIGSDHRPIVADLIIAPGAD